MQLDIVIVTYNRLEKLKKALQCYENQTRGFRNLILVDNCSTDGTHEFADEWSSRQSTFNRIVIHSPENLGGSGGFYLGQKKALELGADWVFVADDDAYASPTMIEEFCRFVETHDCSRFSAICATVRDMDGRISVEHRDRFITQDAGRWPYQEYKRFHVKDEEYNNEFFCIDLLSYVGSFISGQAMSRCGLVNPRYFIYHDDTEHSMRLRKHGAIVVVPKIVITHESIKTSNKQAGLSWRYYYEVRNKTHMLLKHYPRTILNTVFFEFRRWIGRRIHERPTNDADILIGTAVLNAFFGRLGKHPKYKP